MKRFTSLGCVKDRAYGEFVGAVTQSPNSSSRGRNMCEKRAGFKPREEPEMVQALQNLVLEAGSIYTTTSHTATVLPQCPFSASSAVYF